jgi:molybdopterin converting factor small subunit
MKINVLTFGQVTDIINQSSLEVGDIADVNGLKQMLEEKYEQLKGIKYAIAVDKKIVSGNAPLQDKSVVALLPPFSGG